MIKLPQADPCDWMRWFLDATQPFADLPGDQINWKYMRREELITAYARGEKASDYAKKLVKETAK